MFTWVPSIFGEHALVPPGLACRYFYAIASGRALRSLFFPSLFSIERSRVVNSLLRRTAFRRPSSLYQAFSFATRVRTSHDIFFDLPRPTSVMNKKKVRILSLCSSWFGENTITGSINHVGRKRFDCLDPKGRRESGNDDATRRRTTLSTAPALIAYPPSCFPRLCETTCVEREPRISGARSTHELGWRHKGPRERRVSAGHRPNSDRVG